jgi:uncharacterized membrane-anchored protein YhcB (DUF1043 family)
MSNFEKFIFGATSVVFGVLIGMILSNYLDYPKTARQECYRQLQAHPTELSDAVKAELGNQITKTSQYEAQLAETYYKECLWQKGVSE